MTKGPNRERLLKLFRMLGSDNAGERETTRAIIDEILRKHRMTWNDLIELVQAGTAENNTDEGAAPSGETTGTNVSALDVTHYVLQDYLEVSPHEYVAIALWCLHTHVYDRFIVTPRLALVSPVRGCGKTTALALLALLSARGRKDDGITAAAIFRLIDSGHPTLLLDEADNLGFDRNGPLRSVVNSGHQKGGSHTRVIKDAPRRFSTFAPLAIATIGALPLPIMHRSLVIHMSRATRKLRRLDETDQAINVAYGMIRTWAHDVQLNHDPELPTELRNRPADNWRPLISIADSFGPAWGAKAREAAVHFSQTHRDEDAAVILLNDIRDVFNRLNVDRLHSVTLVADLIGMDDALWADWRGLRDDQQPRFLSQGELARLLAPFGIRPRTIWPQRRKQGTRSRKGYLRSQFTKAWQSYCDEGGTAAQPIPFSRLRRA